MAKLIKREEATLLWSDEAGDQRKKSKEVNTQEIVPSETTIGIRLEKNARGGKIVSVLKDLPHNPEYFKKLCQELKKVCGTGGTFKDDCIEIQGDHRDKIKAYLEKQGFKVKFIGG
jgi:translation initiation factor 1